jgi:hypothetical protein
MAGVGGLHCVHGQGADGVGEFSGSGFHGRREEAKGGLSSMRCIFSNPGFNQAG